MSGFRDRFLPFPSLISLVRFSLSLVWFSFRPSLLALCFSFSHILNKTTLLQTLSFCFYLSTLYSSSNQQRDHEQSAEQKGMDCCRPDDGDQKYRNQLCAVLFPCCAGQIAQLWPGLFARRFSCTFSWGIIPLWFPFSFWFRWGILSRFIGYGRDSWWASYDSLSSLGKTEWYIPKFIFVTLFLLSCGR